MIFDTMAALITRSSLLHLRIPFSIFLLPVFLFALSVSPNINPERLAIVFVVLHFLLYPATNGFNSFYDKDEDSIGGLKHPPKVTNDLLYLSLLLDLAAILLALKISVLFALFVLSYGFVSKAYSHPFIRLKKYPWLSWGIAGLFQGAITFWGSYIGLNDFSLYPLQNPNILTAGLLTTLLLWANYPLTQIYQHEEDARRGDYTLSRKLGIKGTFIFSAGIFITAYILFFLYFWKFHQLRFAFHFGVAMTLPVLFFIWWCASYFKKGASTVNYNNTMKLNWIAAIALNAFFIYFFLESTQILQALKGGL